MASIHRILLRWCLGFLLGVSPAAWRPNLAVRAETSSVQGAPEAGQNGHPNCQTKGGWQLCWTQRPSIESPSSRFRFQFGGTLQADFAGFSESAEFKTAQGSLKGSGEWRRAQVYLDGAVGSNWEYRLQYDFALRNPPQLKDAYFQWTGLPVGVMAGRFRTPLGLEEFTSGRNLVFMERGLPNTFFPSRNTGLVLFGSNPQFPVIWNLGLIQNQSDFLIQRFDRIGLSARAARPFWFGTDQLLHVGLSFQYRRVDEFFRYLERPEAHLAPQFVDTLRIPAKSGANWLIESAWVRGPFSVQGEAALTAVNGDSARSQADVRFHGYYFFASLFLTGEQRPYSGRQGRFTGVVPRRTIGDDGGWGAWEAAVRFSHLDLNDRNVRGGEMSNLTWALNWYLNRYSRVQLNLVRADSFLGRIWIYQARVQLAF